MTVHKDKIKNVVLSVDRGFRAEVSRLYGDAGFPGEKVFVASSSEATSVLKFDRQALNICTSPDNLETPAYLEILANINNAIAGTTVLALAYMRLDQAREMSEIRAGLPYLNLRLLPVKRSDFIAVFRSMRGMGMDGFRPPEIQNDRQSERKEAQRKSAKEGTILSFFEATKHLRESVDAVNELHKAPDSLDLLLRVGQRFNGLVGAYCFLQNQPGFKELFHLSVVVDDISRNYRPQSERSSVDPIHLALVTKAVRCAFMILKKLRDGVEPDPLQTEEAMEIFETYLADSTISKRVLVNQDEVEQLMSTFRAG
jgi:hypothetical protein